MCIRYFILIFILSLTACVYEYEPQGVERLENLPDSLNGLKKMRLLQGNRFLMGNSTFSDEQPTNYVELSQFYMDETPVTYADFEKYVNAGGQHTAYHLYESYNQPNYPVTGISWHHAIDFCNWRSKVEGFEPAYEKTENQDTWGFPIWKLKPNATGYRLPTEAEFEYSARAGLEQKQFPWGDKFDPNQANYDTEKGQKTGKRWRIVEVKSEKPNQFGLYQMTGNIRHWCQDWYDSLAYSKLNYINPQGGKNQKTKVVRGGGWGATHPKYLTVSKRDFSAPSNYNFDIGFRCVLPAKALSTPTDTTQEMGLEVIHGFFSDTTAYDFEYVQKLPDFTDKKFIQRLGNFLADYFPNSIYFRQKVDKQKVLKPHELAELIVKVTTKHQINPLFLTGIIVSESGVGSCSFPRWFNNPSAFRWQNRLMKVGLPTYEDKPNVQNRKYHDLEGNFTAFCKGIRRDLYYEAGKQNLYDFHKIYVGYEAKEWMRTLSRVYRDIAQIQFKSNYPEVDAGQFIYLDWQEINPDFVPIFEDESWESEEEIVTDEFEDFEPEIEENQTFEVPVITQKTGKFYLIYGSFAKKEFALEYLQKPDYQNIENPKIIHSNGRFRVVVTEFSTDAEAQKYAQQNATKYKDIWVMEF